MTAGVGPTSGGRRIWVSGATGYVGLPWRRAPARELAIQRTRAISRIRGNQRPDFGPLVRFELAFGGPSETKTRTFELSVTI
jgi:hypothetical protein